MYKKIYKIKHFYILGARYFVYPSDLKTFAEKRSTLDTP